MVIPVIAVWLVVAAGTGTTAPPAQVDRKPNILLIVGDDMGYADIGVQGATDIRTPHLDALAQHGARFTSGYVSGPCCNPTRAALMTGRYQQRYGHEFNWGPPENTPATFGLPLHGKGHASSTWEGGVRVPFLMQWKGRVPAGQVYTQPVIQMDLHATALAAAGIHDQRKLKLDGVDLVPDLKGQQKGSPHEALFWRFGPRMAVRAGDWKLVKAREARRRAVDEFERLGTDADLAGAQLFNLAADIGEKVNLAEKEPARVEALERHGKSGARRWKSPHGFRVIAGVRDDV